LCQVGDADVVSGAHCDVNAVEIERTSIGVQQGVAAFTQEPADASIPPIRPVELEFACTAGAGG
jgi:hypothetical protein